MNPHLKKIKGQEHLSFEFPYQFEDEVFEDFGNSSNYYCEPKPQFPKVFLNETIKELSAIMSEEWLKEVESAPSTLRVFSPSSPATRCLISGEHINILYNPLVGANIISAQISLDLLGD